MHFLVKIIIFLFLLWPIVGAGLIFMKDIAVGVLFALAIPVPSQNALLSNVFMSYNFESNYACPISAHDITNAYLDKFMLPYNIPDPDLDEYRRRPLEQRGFTQNVENTSVKRRQITRKNVYQIIESYLSKACLLRTICESAATPLAKYSGFLGDVVHILLTPSTSIHEGIGEEYYEAERIGNTTKDCEEFVKMCPNNGLDLFTKFF